MKFNIRRAEINDLEFLVQIDLKNVGYTVSDEVEMTEQQKEQHHEKIKRFVAKNIDCSKVHAVYTYGDISKVISDTLTSSNYRGIAKHFTSKDKLAYECLQILGQNDLV
jgi:UDP-N-acetylmuramoyl-tripeptide--D-alanyl-D-alanine ligase